MSFVQTRPRVVKQRPTWSDIVQRGQAKQKDGFRTSLSLMYIENPKRFDCTYQFSSKSLAIGLNDLCKQYTIHRIARGTHCIALTYNTWLLE
jgi:hypothetical protein